MADISYRSRADAARTAAAAGDLPNVRDRHLRSVKARDSAASREEDAAAGLKVRQAETAARRAVGATDDDEDMDR